MTIDLKTYYEATQRAEAKVQELTDRIKGLLEQGAPKSSREVQGLRSELGTAQYLATRTRFRYLSARDGFLFGAVDTGQTTITRAKFDRYSPAERANFVRTGGAIVD
jgi:hypothetical protein